MKKQKPSCPRGQRRLPLVRTTAAYCFFSLAGSSAAEPLGALLDPLGALLAPLAALPLGDELGAELAEPLALVEPPAAESFFVASVDEEALEEDDGVELESFLDMSTDAEPEVELEPDGVLGVVEPADDDDDAGGVVRETEVSSLSQPVSNPAPSARDTATAKVVSLMCGPPWVGVKDRGARIGPVALRS